MRAVLLLRAINLGAHRKMKMPELRAALEHLGLTDVQTYLQSGNAVFTADEDDAEALRTRIESAIEARFGFPVETMILSAAEWDELARGCPFPADEWAHTFAAPLSGVPDGAAVARLRAFACAPERWALSGRTLYLHYPEGAGRARLTHAVIERRLGVQATLRNWRTVTAVQALLHR